VTAAEIAARLGGAHRSGGWWRCRCPVHNSRSATLALRDGDRELIAKCWAGCDRRHVLAELRRRGLLGAGNPYFSLAEPARRTLPAGDDIAARIAAAQRIWNAARDARGGPVARYLAGRGITTAPPAALRWATRCWLARGGRYRPAMVARVDDSEGQLIGVHRTWLDRDAAGHWQRGDRASLGPIGGGAVLLAPVSETLLIGEGIETSMSAMQACGLPAWAALSAGGIEALNLPSIVRGVIILADHDANGRGQRAAYAAARRWLAEGRRVRIALPPEPGTDFNDVLLGCARSSAAEARNAIA
jgi:putative DNA primase/helicase